MDWSDEVAARLSVGFTGHVPGGSCEAEQPCLGCDIRAALAEIERARISGNDWRITAGAEQREKWREQQDKQHWRERYEAAETKLADAQAEIERLGRDRAEIAAALGPHAHPGLSPAANVVELRQRAEAAEAKLAEAQGRTDRLAGGLFGAPPEALRGGGK